MSPGLPRTSGCPHRVLLVDTLSASNDFGVELPMALDPLVELTVFTLRGSRLRNMGCRRVLEAFPEYGGTRSYMAKLLTELFALLVLVVEIWRHRRGAIHVQFFRFAWLELPVYALLRPFVRRMVLTVHNALPHEQRFWQAWLYRRWYGLQDRFHVLSEHTGRVLVDEFGIEPNRISLVPHGNYARFRADHPPTDAQQVRARFGINPGATLFLFFGLIRPYKGVDLLIDAAQVADDPEICVLICGGCSEQMATSMRQQLRGRTTRTVILTVTGFLENQTLSDVIAASDVAVFPYRHIYQSGSLLLAMTYGKAILANRLTGFQEYVVDGDSAAMCNAADAKEFAACLQLLARNAALRIRLEEAASKLAHERYDWHAIAKSITAMYV